MTDDTSIPDPAQIRRDRAKRLRAVQVSDHFQAILGCLLGEDWLVWGHALTRDRWYRDDAGIEFRRTY